MALTDLLVSSAPASDMGAHLSSESRPVFCFHGRAAAQAVLSAPAAVQLHDIHAVAPTMPTLHPRYQAVLHKMNLLELGERPLRRNLHAGYDRPLVAPLSRFVIRRLATRQRHPDRLLADAQD